MISPILPTHDADTVALDFGVFVAEHARIYRTSQTAIIAALLPSITPSQPPSQAPAAFTPTTAPVDVQAEGDDASSSADQSAAPVIDPAKPTGSLAKHAAEASPDAGGVQDRCESTPPPTTEPQPISTPAVQAQGVSEDSCPSETTATSRPGVEGAADRDLKSGKSVGAKAPAAPDTKRAAILKCHADNPDWPSKLIAKHVGASEDLVRATASKFKLTLVSWWDYQRTQKAATTEALKVRPSKPIAGQQKAYERVKEVFEANPHWTARQIAVAAGCSYSTASIWVSQMRNALRPAKPQAAVAPSEAPQLATPPAPPPPTTAAPAKAKRVTLADKIRAHLADHPDATLKELTDAIGGKMQAIGWAAKKAGIVIRKRTAEERSEASARGAQKRVEAEPVIVGPGPQDDVSDVLHRVKRAPSGRFYLRDKVTGHFVHQSLQAGPTGPGPLMTSDRKWAWFDTMERYRGAKKKWPELAAMRKEAAQP